MAEKFAKSLEIAVQNSLLFAVDFKWMIVVRRPYL